jgi:hypothetical protein
MSFAEMLGNGVIYYVVYALSALLFVGASVEAWMTVLRVNKKLR